MRVPISEEDSKRVMLLVMADPVSEETKVADYVTRVEESYRDVMTPRESSQKGSRLSDILNRRIEDLRGIAEISAEASAEIRAEAEDLPSFVRSTRPTVPVRKGILNDDDNDVIFDQE